MKETVLLIKNMVCSRCVEAVATIFERLGKTAKIELGKAYVQSDLSVEEKEQLAQLLNEKGFELLEDTKSALISQIKTLIIQQIHHSENPLQLNISDFVAEAVSHDYRYLSRLFSSVEGITLEKYYTKQRIEKVKELLFYGEMTLADIAYQLGYSSVAYLSSSFKKETGMTPKEFKRLGNPQRVGLDKI